MRSERTARQLLFYAALGLLVSACAARPRPPIMAQVAELRQGPAVTESKRLAPQAFLHAEALVKRADRAFQSGDTAGAQLISEQAIAAYNHAFALARLAKAHTRAARAEHAAKQLEQSLVSIDEQQRRVAAEADALEMQGRVARDALPVVPSAPASPAREAARREAAEATLLQARLLCVATHLLAPETKGLAEVRGAIDAVARTLSTAPKVTPIDETVRLRSTCLAKLTAARRAGTRTAPEAGAADKLLSELSQAKHDPVRDDRGVVVTLRSLFSSGTPNLTENGQQAIRELGQVAREHSDFPLLVVVHKARGAANDQDQQRSDVVVAALEAAGAGAVQGHAAGSVRPAAPGNNRAAVARNERVEIVFVAPTW